jgi:hypothetical protein
VIAAAERRVVDAQAQAELRRLLDDPHAEPVKDPIDRLARLAGRIENAVDVVGKRVSDLQSLGIVTAAGGEQLKAEVRLWEMLLGHLRASLDTLARHGWMERQTLAAEMVAEAYGQLVAAALDGAGVAGEARDRGFAAARARLTALDGGAA